MKKQKHIDIHRELHKKLDELIADFITHTGKTPSNATIMELIEWSHFQTTKPTENEENNQ